MEYASVLAGESFSDHPRCTDPVLATLARLVNDTTTDRGRQSLGRLAPGLVTASRTNAVGSASLVLATLLHALAATGRSPALERHTYRAHRRLRRVSDRGLRGRLARGVEAAHRHGPGRRRLIAAVDATVRLPESERDTVLRDMLIRALAIHPVTPPWQRPAPSNPTPRHTWTVRGPGK
jgi:hypothetical protein